MRGRKTECEKQFFVRNRINFLMTVITLLLAAVMNTGLAFMLRYFIEAVEYSSKSIFMKGCIAGNIYLCIYILFGIMKRNYRNKYIRTALSQFFKIWAETCKKRRGNFE